LDRVRADKLAISSLGDVNYAHKHRSVVTALSFVALSSSNSASLLLSAGLDKCLYFHDVDGRALLKRVFVADLPIRCARVSPSGAVILGGRRRFLYWLDLSTFAVDRVDRLLGRDERAWEYFEASPDGQTVVFVGVRGDVVIVSAETRRPIKRLSLPAQIVALRFVRGGARMMALTAKGEVMEVAMCGYRCVARHRLEGVVTATCFDVKEAADGRCLLAVGCTSGVVSVFRFGGDGDDGAVELMYAVDNLVTTVHGVEFNCDAQLMVIWSRSKKCAVRVVHVESGRVFGNWPRDASLAFVHKATFSPNSGYLAIGNDKGLIRLHRLHFYGAT